MILDNNAPRLNVHLVERRSAVAPALARVAGRPAAFPNVSAIYRMDRFRSSSRQPKHQVIATPEVVLWRLAPVQRPPDNQPRHEPLLMRFLGPKGHMSGGMGNAVAGASAFPDWLHRSGVICTIRGVARRGG